MEKTTLAVVVTVAFSVVGILADVFSTMVSKEAHFSGKCWTSAQATAMFESAIRLTSILNLFSRCFVQGDFAMRNRTFAFPFLLLGLTIGFGIHPAMAQQV